MKKPRDRQFFLTEGRKFLPVGVNTRITFNYLQNPSVKEKCERRPGSLGDVFFPGYFLLFIPLYQCKMKSELMSDLNNKKYTLWHEKNKIRKQRLNPFLKLRGA